MIINDLNFYKLYDGGMALYKIAYYSASDSDLIVLGNAVEKVVKEKGRLFEVLAKNKQDLRNDEDRLEFINYVGGADILIICLHGGKESCPAFDELIKALPETSEIFIKPCNVSDVDIAMEHTTLNKEYWTKISQYLTYGGVDNIVNMLLFIVILSTIQIINFCSLILCRGRGYIILNFQM